MRRLRRVVSFVCTTCFKSFPDKASGMKHAESHGGKKPRLSRRGFRRGRRVKQTALVLGAIRSGAKTAAAISKKTGIPNARVHTLLSYHRRKGNITGYTGRLRVV